MATIVTAPAATNECLPPRRQFRVQTVLERYVDTRSSPAAISMQVQAVPTIACSKPPQLSSPPSPQQRRPQPLRGGSSSVPAAAPSAAPVAPPTHRPCQAATADAAALPRAANFIEVIEREQQTREAAETALRHRDCQLASMQKELTAVRGDLASMQVRSEAMGVEHAAALKEARVQCHALEAECSRLHSELDHRRGRGLDALTNLSAVEALENELLEGLRAAHARKAMLHEARRHAEETRTQCIICWNEERQMLFQPCGHVTACAKCGAAERLGSSCPTCRAKIESRIRVFL